MWGHDVYPAGSGFARIGRIWVRTGAEVVIRNSLR